MQARWRQLRSCAGALKSITWAYRTRVAPFEPDALHPNADDDQAEQILRLALVDWRQGLSAGADLNNTTLRKHFPESVFKHNQRQPKAGFWRWQRRWANRLFKRCCAKSCRESADRGQIKARAINETRAIIVQHKKAQCTAYCAPFLFHCRPTQPGTTPNFTPTRSLSRMRDSIQLDEPHPTHLNLLRSGVTVLFCAAERLRLLQAHLA